MGSPSPDDVALPAVGAGAAALAAVAGYALTDATRVADIAAVAIAIRRPGGGAGGDDAAAPARRRQARRLGASSWLFTDEALQQATAAPGGRAPGRDGWQAGPVHDVTCSIGTELAALRGAGAELVGSDIDPVRLAMARHNVGEAAHLCRADALHPVTPGHRGARRPGAPQTPGGDASTRATTSPACSTRCSTPTGTAISS